MTSLTPLPYTPRFNPPPAIPSSSKVFQKGSAGVGLLESAIAIFLDPNATRADMVGAAAAIGGAAIEVITTFKNNPILTRLGIAGAAVGLFAAVAQIDDAKKALADAQYGGNSNAIAKAEYDLLDKSAGALGAFGGLLISIPDGQLLGGGIWLAASLVGAIAKDLSSNAEKGIFKSTPELNPESLSKLESAKTALNSVAETGFYTGPDPLNPNGNIVVTPNSFIRNDANGNPLAIQISSCGVVVQNWISPTDLSVAQLSARGYGPDGNAFGVSYFDGTTNNVWQKDELGNIYRITTTAAGDNGVKYQMVYQYAADGQTIIGTQVLAYDPITKSWNETSNTLIPSPTAKPFIPTIPTGYSEDSEMPDGTRIVNTVSTDPVTQVTTTTVQVYSPAGDLVMTTGTGDIYSRDPLTGVITVTNAAIGSVRTYDPATNTLTYEGPDEFGNPITYSRQPQSSYDSTTGQTTTTGLIGSNGVGLTHSEGETDTGYGSSDTNDDTGEVVSAQKTVYNVDGTIDRSSTTTTTDPLTNATSTETTSTTYNPQGQPSGSAMTYETRDATGQLTYQVRETYDTSGQITKTEDTQRQANGDMLTSTRSASGQVTATRLTQVADDGSQVVTQTNTLTGEITVTTYNAPPNGAPEGAVGTVFSTSTSTPIVNPTTGLVVGTQTTTQTANATGGTDVVKIHKDLLTGNTTETKTTGSTTNSVTKNSKGEIQQTAMTQRFDDGTAISITTNALTGRVTYQEVVVNADGTTRNVGTPSYGWATVSAEQAEKDAYGDAANDAAWRVMA